MATARRTHLYAINIEILDLNADSPTTNHSCRTLRFVYLNRAYDFPARSARFQAVKFILKCQCDVDSMISPRAEPRQNVTTQTTTATMTTMSCIDESSGRPYAHCTFKRTEKESKQNCHFCGRTITSVVMWIVTRELLLVKCIIVGLIARLCAISDDSYGDQLDVIRIPRERERERCQRIAPALWEWSASYSVSFQTIRCHAVTEQFFDFECAIRDADGHIESLDKPFCCASPLLPLRWRWRWCLLEFQRIQLFPVWRQPLTRFQLYGTHCASGEEFVYYYYEMKWFPGATHWLRLCHEFSLLIFRWLLKLCNHSSPAKANTAIPCSPHMHQRKLSNPNFRYFFNSCQCPFLFLVVCQKPMNRLPFKCLIYPLPMW